MKVAEFTQALLSIDRVKAREILTSDVEQSHLFSVIEELVVPSLEQIGRQWEQGTIALSQVYMSGIIVEALIDEFLPPAHPDRIDQPAMAIAVLNDFHLLGKRIISSVLRASGYELLDFGRVTVDQLIQRTLQEKIQILLISTLMLPSALDVKAVIAGLREAGSSTRVIVGGAPFRLDASLYKEVDADGTAVHVRDIIGLITQLVEEVQ